jgi:hypothetical protein
MNKVKINIKDQPNNLVTMTDDQLLEMVEKEMKKRKLKIKEETK